MWLLRRRLVSLNEESLAQIAKTISELGRRDSAIQKEIKQRTASRDKAAEKKLLSEEDCRCVFPEKML